MEEEVSLGQLGLSEVFSFTNNSAHELAFHNGTSSSQTMFKLVLIFKNIEMTHGVIFDIMHIAATIIID